MSAAPSDNIFVKILNGEIPSHEVYSDEQVYCFLDIFPQAPGHTLVIPRNYSPNVQMADPADIAHCMAAVRKLIPALKTASGAKGVTVITNMGREAGQMIEYLHFHVIPRNPGDSISFYELGAEMPAEELAEMASKIKSELA